jgi:glycosyltransferase involved in cell wall biosynthesis
MTDPLVDVLIPVFNGERTVRQAIKSIQRQSIDNLKILVIDDGSTDSTPQILAELSRADPRVQVLNKANSGIVDALNLGLNHCRAEFVARQDADDLAYPTRLADQIAYLRGHPECVAVSGAARHIDEHGQPTGVVAHGRPPSSADPNWVPSKEPYLMHPFLMTRRSSIQKVRGYRYAFHSEDTDLYWRLLEVGILHNMDDVLGDYRLHSQSITGASVLNGRISALNSQLASVSAIRRRRSRPDLTFPKDAIFHYQRVRSLAGIFEVGRRELDDEETAYLEISLATKMMDLASYRPFELEYDDCTYIRAAVVKHAHRLARDNNDMINRMWSGTAARLAHTGLLKEAVALLPPGYYPTALARLAFRACVPTRIRQRVRNQPYK